MSLLRIIIFDKLFQIREEHHAKTFIHESSSAHQTRSEDLSDADAFSRRALRSLDFKRVGKTGDPTIGRVARKLLKNMVPASRFELLTPRV